MFSFFTLPKTWLNGPIIQTEITHLRKLAQVESRWIRWFGKIVTVLACLSAMLPLLLFMSDQIRTYVLIFFMGLTIYLVHLQAVLRTLTLASYAIARETESGNWDNLVMTGVDARNIVIGKWWAVIRCVWKDHLLAAILKFGIAIALSQYFHVVYLGSCYRHLGGGLCYGSNVYYPYFPHIANEYLWSPYGALFTLIAFGLSEAGLLTAIGLCTGMFSKYRVIGMAWAIAIRGFLVAVAISGFFLLGIRSRMLYEVPDYNSVHLYMNVWERQNIVGTIQIGLSTFADSGTIIATDVMRRVWGYDYLSLRLVLIGIMLTTFVFLTKLSLQLAQHFAIRNHALRPPD